MSSSFTLKLLDQLSKPARTMHRALKELLGAEESVTKASKATGAAASAAGAAVAAAGRNAERGAKGFERAAQSMRVAARNASFAQVRVGYAAGGMGGRAAAFAGGRRMLGSVGIGSSFGPIYNPSAQGAAAGGMGPIFDRKAQGVGMFTRAGWGTADTARDLAAMNSAAGEGIERWQALSSAFMRTPFGYLLSGLGSVGSALFSVVRTIGSALIDVGKLTTALGVLAAAGFTKVTLEMNAFADRAKKSLGFITGDEARGNMEFRWATRLLGDIEDVTSAYTKLRSMQFRSVEAVGLTKLSTDLKAITGDSEAAKRAITAMTQIKAKGRLQSEELVGQLAEAGVSTVLVYQQLEKLLGKDRKGVLKALQGGQIDSETGLVAVVRALKQKYHIQNFGTIGKTFAEGTLSGLWESLANTPKRMFTKIGEQVDTRPLVKGLQHLKRFLDGAFSTGNAVRFVNAMVVGISKLIPLATAFASGFGDGLDAISKALMVGKSGNLVDWARGAGRETARFFERVIQVSKEVVPQIGRALAALFEGVNVDKILEGIKSFDWAAFGRDLSTIARALGQITGATASGIGGAAQGTTAIASAMSAGNGTTGWAPIDLVRDIFNGDFFKAFDVTDWSNTGALIDAIREKGMPWNGPPTPRAVPVIGPDATSRNMTNSIKNELNLYGFAGAPEELDAVNGAAEDGTLRALRRFAAGELAQATG